jgi:hypothetical protein
VSTDWQQLLPRTTSNSAPRGFNWHLQRQLGIERPNKESCHTDRPHQYMVSGIYQQTFMISRCIGEGSRAGLMSVFMCAS